MQILNKLLLSMLLTFYLLSLPAVAMMERGDVSESSSPIVAAQRVRASQKTPSSQEADPSSLDDLEWAGSRGAPVVACLTAGGELLGFTKCASLLGIPKAAGVTVAAAGGAGCTLIAVGGLIIAVKTVSAVKDSLDALQPKVKGE